MAKAAEASLAAIKTATVGSATSTSHALRGGGRSFLMLPQTGPNADMAEIMETMGPEAWMQMTGQQLQESSVFAALPNNPTPTLAPTSEFLQQVMVSALMIESGDVDQVKAASAAVLSMAKQAMKAADAAANRRRCWGCGADNHLWRNGTDCPRSKEPDVQQRAREAIRAFTQRPMAAMAMEHRRQGLEQSWQQEGFESLETADLMHACTDAQVECSYKRVIDEVSSPPTNQGTRPYGGPVTPGTTPLGFPIIKRRSGVYSTTS